MAREEKPDLILLGAGTTGAVGQELSAVLRTHPETQRTPIILVTSPGEVRNYDADRRAGCTGHLGRPFTSAELLAKVRSCLVAVSAPTPAPAARPTAAPRPA